MFNKNYYQGKKDELNKKFETNKNQFIMDITNVVNKFYEIQKDLQDRFAELDMREKESAAKTEEENKKIIDEKVKGGK